MGGWPEQFFSSTPRIVGAVMEGRARAAKSKMRLAGWHAHTVATLDRVRRLPTLAKLIDGPDLKQRLSGQARPTTELLSLARRWMVAIAPEAVADER